jgi:hypothetical protein
VAKAFMTHTDCPYIQIVKTPDVWKKEDNKVVISAARVFSGLP